MTRLVFVSDRVDPHRERFANLFSEVTSEVLDVVVSRESGEHLLLGSWSNWAELRALLETQPSVVVSGPLDTVSGQLLEGKYPHVGISWATDVMVTAASSIEALRSLIHTVRSLDAVITDNVATENALLAVGVRPDAILRVPWGPENHLPSTSVYRSSVGLPEAVPLVLFPRSLSEHYQPLIFLDAFERVRRVLPDVRAALVKSGDLLEATEVRARELNLEGSLHWIEPLESGNFRSLLSMVDAVVVAPITDGTSVTLLEAMEAGVPVVSSLTSGSAEWVMHGVTGFTFPVGNSDALADSLLKALSLTPDERSLLADHAKKLVQVRAGWAVSAKRISALLKSFLEI